METTIVDVDRKEARRLYRQYKEHSAYSKAIDREIRRAYQLIAQGRMIIRAIESIRAAGVNEEHLPKLAIAPATAEACHLWRNMDGSATMAPTSNRWKRTNCIAFDIGTFAFPRESFPIAHWHPKPQTRQHFDNHQAMMPIIPIHLRPKKALHEYHVLWEAEWHRIPPRDPLLLRRIGKADLWVVVASWELTEVERAALATRINVQ